MTVTSVDAIVDGLDNTKQELLLSSGAIVTVTTGNFYSMWTGSTGIPGDGSIPPLYDSGGPYTCFSGTVGALPIMPATNQNYIAGITLSNTVAASYVLADRLWACSFGTISGTTYTITTPGSLPPRITDNGVGCQIWIETFNQVGSIIAGTWQVNYIDSNGVPRTAPSPAVVGLANAPAGFMRQIPHAPGAYGVSQITSVVRTGTGGSAGTHIGVTILNPLLCIPCPDATATTVMEWGKTALPKLHNDGCYMMYRLTTATTASTTWGSITIIDK